MENDNPMNETDLIYIAEICDEIAYIGIKRTNPSKDRVSPSYIIRLQIRMAEEEIVKFIAQSLGRGYYKERHSNKSGEHYYCYEAANARAVTILRKLLPYLGIKREVAETALRLRDLQANGKSYRTKVTGHHNFPNKYGTKRIIPNLAYSEEYLAKCDDLWRRCKEINSESRRHKRHKRWKSKEIT